MQLYGLNGTAPGTYTSTDIKYVTVKASCTAGQPLGDADVEKAGRIQTSTVTVSSITSAIVEGMVDLAFQDGSKASGSFSVPICGSTSPETSVCF